MSPLLLARVHNTARLPVVPTIVKLGDWITCSYDEQTLLS